MDHHKSEVGFKPKDYFMTLRMVLLGNKNSPPLNESMEVLGKEMVRFRLRDALNSQQLKN